ncbi:MAG: hypothetical protein JWM72_3328, partial [Actinomycetia bacterium]|nr:hypothetical protein [Actinomycetes bacterium]
MPRYVALLRSVNVGGRKVPMADLRAVFEELGYTDVRTYIQSGNVVFDAKSGNPARIRSLIESELKSEFGMEITVLLRTPAELGKIVKRNPFDENAYVTFLDKAPARKLVEAIDPAAFAPDEFVVDGLEVFVRCPNGYGRTKINNAFFERKLA